MLFGYPAHAADRFNYSVEDRDAKSVVRRGNSNTNGLRLNELILKQNTRYRYWLYDAERGHVGYSEFVTPSAGLTFSVPPPAMRLPTTPDQDGDGLPDEVEHFITGSSVTKPDTDGDGIKDGPALQLGLLNRSLPPTGVIGSVDTPGNAVDVAAYNDLVVVADSDRGISVFNVFNRMSPVIIAQVDTPGNATAVAISGNLIAVADGAAGLAIIDISDPPNARIIHQIPCDQPSLCVAVAGTLAFVGLEGGEIALVDMATGSVLSRRRYAGGTVNDLSIAGDFVYTISVAGNFPQTVHKIRVGPLLGEPEGTLPLLFGPTFGRLHIFAAEDLIFVGAIDDNFTNQTPGVTILQDTGTDLILVAPSSPITAFDIASSSPGLLLFIGADASLLVNPQLGLLDVTDPTRSGRFIASFDTPGAAKALTIYNGLAYIADGTSGLAILNYMSIDISNRAPEITLSGSLVFSNPTHAAIEEAKHVRVVADVTDDVQVRNVEFYIDGVKAATDGNYPFEFRLLAPRRETQSSFRLKARVSDTGGNSAWSEEVVVDLTKDATPPFMVSAFPSHNTNLVRVDILTAFFDEPLDSNSVTSAVLEVRGFGADQTFETADDLVLTNGFTSYIPAVNGVMVNLTSRLPTDTYRVRLAPTVSDIAGNLVGAAVTWQFTIVPGTTVIGNVVDTNDVPIVGAIVRIVNLDVSQVSTDAFGRFNIVEVPATLGPIIISVRGKTGERRFSAFVQVEGAPYGITDVGTIVGNVLEFSAKSRFSAGSMQSAAVRQDGTLWTWGIFDNSRPEDLSFIDKVRPKQVGTNVDWLTVAAGGQRTLGLRTDGTLWSWGWDDVVEQYLEEPVQIDPQSTWETIAGGSHHYLAIREDGSLWAWGINDCGQLGSTSEWETDPVRVAGNAEWRSVSAGYCHTMAIRLDGTLWAWGLNNFGQLGVLTTSWRSYLPLQVGTNADWVAVSAGAAHTVGIRSDGTLWAWGANHSGQLGDEFSSGTNKPIQLGSDSNWVSASAGGRVVDSEGYTLAVRRDGSLWGWGVNNRGQLGNSPSDARTPRPVRIGTDSDWLAVTSTSWPGPNGWIFGEHNLGLKVDGSLWSWGSGGALGNSAISEIHEPVVVGTNATWLAVSAGGETFGAFTLAIQNNGTLWSWGRNDYGQLGNGTAVHQNQPIQIGTNYNWIEATAGERHSAAIRSDGTLFTWGTSFYGALGLGALRETNRPVIVGTNSSWQTSTAGGDYTVALRENGSLWTWGLNDYGQLGTGTNSARNQPVEVAGDSAWQTIAVGGYSDSHTVALRVDGTLWTWGGNGRGQLGNGTWIPTNRPSQVATNSTWRAIAAGGAGANNFDYYGFTLAIRSDGTLWAWGDNRFGQLGASLPTGSFTSYFGTNQPVQVGSDSNWQSISAGGSHVAALRVDGTLWAWGGNQSGQIGDGTRIDRSLPIRIGTNSDWRAVATGGSREHGHTLAIRADGTLWAWGDNSSGQIAQPVRWLPYPVIGGAVWGAPTNR